MKPLTYSLSCIGFLNTTRQDNIQSDGMVRKITQHLEWHLNMVTPLPLRYLKKIVTPLRLSKVKWLPFHLIVLTSVDIWKLFSTGRRANQGIMCQNRWQFEITCHHHIGTTSKMEWDCQSLLFSLVLQMSECQNRIINNFLHLSQRRGSGHMP